MGLIGSITNTIIFHSGSLLGFFFREDYLKKAKNGKKVSEKFLLKIIRKNMNTEYGKINGFSQIRSIDDFQNRVPLSTYEDYKEYIDQTRIHGKQNLICSKKISKFATTSGTTSIKKYLPQSNLTFVAFFKCVCIFVNQCIKALKRRKVSSFNVKGFLVTEVTDAYETQDENGSAGYFTQYAAGTVKVFMPIFTQMPKEVIACGEIEDKEYIKCRYALQDKTLKFIVAAFMSSVTYSIGYIEKNYEMLIEDIEKGIINPDIKISDSIRHKLQAKLKPDPERAAELRKIFSTTSNIPLLSRIWPDMSFVLAIGSADFEPFTKTVRELCYDDVTFNYSLYACSESMIGCAINPDDPRYLLLDTAFYEFIPVGIDKSNQILLMSELEIDKLYEIVLTTNAGLYRYQLKDVIRVVGYEGETPMIEFAYRANFVTDLCGVHVTGDHLSSSIKDLEKDYQLHALDYSIYANTDYKNPHIELFVEFEQEINKENIKKMELSFEEYMNHYAWDYYDYRRVEQIQPVELHVVKKDTYFNYRTKMLSNGASSNQLKAMRLIDTEEKLNYLKSNLL